MMMPKNRVTMEENRKYLPMILANGKIVDGRDHLRTAKAGEQNADDQ